MRLLTLCCALLWALPVMGQEQLPVTKLALSPQGEPKPALKFLLLPDLLDKKPGNSVQAFYKCFMEQNVLYHDKQLVEDRTKWLTCPLADLPKDAENYGGTSARQALYAARLEGCDWQILQQLKSDGINLLLPDIQQLRSLSQVLKVRTRGQVKAGKFDDAIRTIQTNLALAKCLGEHPTLIGNLVGIAIAQQTIGTIEKLIQQPGAPNLYWALVQLPSSLVDVRQALQGERVFVRSEFAGFTDPSRVWSDDDIAQIIAKVRGNSGMLNTKEAFADAERWVKARSEDAAWLQKSQQNLIELGCPEAKVKQYPPGQVIFLRLLFRQEVLRDDMAKWAALPFWQADEAMERTESAKLTDIEDILASSLSAAVRKVRAAQARLDQRFAMLQVVEAIRLHAAAHDGKLPATPGDIKLPLPVDPVTGKPFEYTLRDGRGLLVNTVPKGTEKIMANHIRYEITLR